MLLLFLPEPALFSSVERKGSCNQPGFLLLQITIKADRITTLRVFHQHFRTWRNGLKKKKPRARGAWTEEGALNLEFIASRKCISYTNYTPPTHHSHPKFLIKLYKPRICNLDFTLYNKIRAEIKIGDIVSKETVRCVGGKVKH